jgi:cystathionine beta-lyase/cystathionine gamma-synthase
MTIYTAAVHAGKIEPKPGTPSAPPIVAASSWSHDSLYALDDALEDPASGYVYARNAAPTQEAFEAAVAKLERAAGAAAYASGMAALHAALLAAADHLLAEGGDRRAGIVAATELYGASRSLLQRLGRETGLQVSWVNVRDHESVEQALAGRPPGAVLVFEVMSNPLCRLADVQALTRLARQYQTRVVVDSTFSTPYLIRPLELGADFVVHSATKYIGGHGDVLAGVAAAAAEEDVQRLHSTRTLLGNNLSPFDAFLALRGLRTLALRVREQNRNALGIAEWLEKHPRVGRVYYPGLHYSPDRSVAEQQFRPGCFGGMLSFEMLRAGRNEIFVFMNKLQVFQRLATLGDVASLVSYPAMASHRSLSPDQRAALGISDTCLRLSAGIEDLGDLLADLAQALTA